LLNIALLGQTRIAALSIHGRHRLPRIEPKFMPVLINGDHGKTQFAPIPGLAR